MVGLTAHMFRAQPKSYAEMIKAEQWYLELHVSIGSIEKFQYSAIILHLFHLEQ